tara:strand:- start:2906 stop:4531 length:1626 start_codon:yes stop_codon:yes gene_type:complete
MTSVTNQIIANIKKTTTSPGNYTNSENVVCIDTSFNRIGINKKNPQYSIDISGTTNNHAIKVNNLIIDNKANINEISSVNINVSTISCGILNCLEIANINDISCVDISCSKLDCSTVECSNELSANKIIVSDISIINKLVQNEISCNKLKVFDLSADTIDVDSLNVTNINLEVLDNAKFSDLKIVNLDLSYLDALEISTNFLNIDGIISISGNLDICGNLDIYGNLDICGNLDISGILNISGNIISNGSGTYNSISTIDLSVTNIITDDISSNNIVVINEISANAIKVNLIRDDQGKAIIENGKIKSENVFNDLTIDNLKIKNKVNLIKDATIDLSKATLILPQHDKTINKYETQLTSDMSRQELVFNCISGSTSSENRIKFIPIYKYMFLKSEENFYKNNATKTIRMQPIELDDIENNSIELIDSSNIKIKETGLYEIHANLVLQYENIEPGDVEVTAYTFKLVRFNPPTRDDLIETKNTIIAFDQSYNYSNSSIFHIFTVNDSNILDKYKFEIMSDRGGSDIDRLKIVNFNTIIKRINI